MTACARKPPLAEPGTPARPPTGGGQPVAILLATYNGARFLPEQLDSLRDQRGADWILFWRDDGSTDATVSIMNAFAATLGEGRCRRVIDNAGGLGACGSFMALLQHVRVSLPQALLAFCDQDDVWLPDKLARAVSALSGLDPARPALYCARQILVDAGLQRIGVSPPLGLAGTAPSLPRALAQNVVTGCTAVLTPALAALMAALPPPVGSMHDWWAYILTAGSGGRLIADEEPAVLYRQHGGNTVGAPASLPARAWAALRRGPRQFMDQFRRHLAVLRVSPGTLTPEARAACEILGQALSGGWGSRIKAMRLPGLRRRTGMETWLFRLWFLTG